MPNRCAYKFHNTRYAICYNVTLGPEEEFGTSGLLQRQLGCRRTGPGGSPFLGASPTRFPLIFQRWGSAEHLHRTTPQPTAIFVMKDSILSPLEATCLRWVSRGRTISEIASLESKSVADIEHCLQSALVALKAKSIAEALPKAKLMPAPDSKVEGSRCREARQASIATRNPCMAQRPAEAAQIPLSCDGVLALRRIFQDQPVKGPLASCGRSGFASR
jgi:DNA-binding CsgD family transcriptional regulator